MTAALRTAGLALALALGATAAEAAPGFTTGNVNMRAGPDTEYPRVTVIPNGQPVEIAGCLSNQSWCDVIWGNARGWVYGEYLGFAYEGRTVLVPEYAPVIGIPVVGFNFGNYWGTYYRGAPWYNQYNRWQSYNPRPRPGWGAPPPGPGPRPANWWRPGYRPPPGQPGQPGWHGQPGGPPPGAPVPGQPGWHGQPGGPPPPAPGQPQSGRPVYQQPHPQGGPPPGQQQGRPPYPPQGQPQQGQPQQGQPQQGRPPGSGPGQRPQPNCPPQGCPPPPQ